MQWIRLAWAALAFALPQTSHALILDFSQVLGGDQGNLGTNTHTTGPFPPEMKPVT